MSKRAAELLATVNVDPGIFLKRYPEELSGSFIADFVGTDRTLKRLRLVNVAAALEPAAAFQVACHQTTDHDEAVRAIIDRRPPRFGKPG